MKQKSRTLILLSWIHDILLFEGIYVLAIAIWNIRGREVFFFLLNGLFMIFPVALSYLVVSKCKNLWLFLIFSLVTIWGIHTASGNIVTSWLTVFVFLFRFYVKMKQGEIRRKMKEMPNAAGAQEDKATWEVPTLLDAPRIPHCLILTGMYLGMLSFGRPELLHLMLGLLAAEFCVCLAYCYLESLEGFVRKNIRVANLPAGTMKKIGNAILLAGIVGLVLFMLPAAIYHKEPLANLRLPSLDMEGEMADLYQENTEPDYLMEELLRLKSQAKKTPEWLKLASELLYNFTLLGVILGVIKIIFMAIRKAMETFSDDSNDEIIFLDKGNDSRTEKEGRLRSGKKESFLSADRRIRRLYKKMLRRALKEKPYGNETPTELETKAGLTSYDREDVKRIHELYEKARYGLEECTPEEAKQCGHILSGFKFPQNRR